jgi:sigma-B regulation protein RsbU (phosphoserine phosphatase)
MQASIKIDRYKTEMKLAQQIQVGLLPKTPPVVSGLEIWSSNHPVQGVGGDFFDFISNPDDSMTFVVGDICGKGMSAAMIMTMVRIVVRMVASNEPDLSPGEILELSNKLLYADLDNTRTFATVFIGRYDPTTRRMLYANAGHSPVVYCPNDGKANLLAADSAPIGTLDTAAIQNNCLVFQPGDVLVIGTDGLTEAYDPLDLDLAHKRLLKYTEHYSDRPVHVIGASLLAPLRGYQKAFITEDDQILFVLKGSALQASVDSSTVRIPC